MEHTPAWLTSSLIYLSAAVLAVPLARALGLGSILGYLIAGVVIGPFGVGLVSNTQDILHFAEFGVVLMLFLVGLELEPKRLWALRGPIFGWGGTQVLGCATLLMLAGVAMGVSWPVALVGALGLALSSTAIALQVMAERRMLKTPTGEANFSILLFQDVAAIPILALIPLLPLLPSSAGSDHAASGNPWISGATAMGAIAAIVLGGRLLLRPLLRWIAASKTAEIFTATALLLVVGIAWAMQFVGLSMALGAFLGGVLLAESEYKRQLEADLEPFKGLLLGLFFIAVGMSIDFAAIAAAPWIVGAVVLGFLAIKTLVIFFLAMRMEIAVAERPVFTLLLAQGGEFAFVVFQTALDAKVIDPRTSSLLVGAVALSMLASPLLLVLLDRFVLPRLATAKRTLEEINETQDTPVLVTGFGRYGQIVSRLMMANGVATTVLDFDAVRIESARTFGYRVFYGDATRLDLLRVAGAGTAKVIIVALDDASSVNTVVDLAHQHFPRAQLVVRVRDLTHAYDMLDRGITTFERELFHSSLSSARQALQALGHSASEAGRMAERFEAHNMIQMKQQHAVRHDRTQLIALAKQNRADLEDQMAQDRQALQTQQEHADAVADQFGLPGSENRWGK